MLYLEAVYKKMPNSELYEGYILSHPHIYIVNAESIETARFLLETAAIDELQSNQYRKPRQDIQIVNEYLALVANI